MNRRSAEVLKVALVLTGALGFEAACAPVPTLATPTPTPVPVLSIAEFLDAQCKTAHRTLAEGSLALPAGASRRIDATHTITVNPDNSFVVGPSDVILDHGVFVFPQPNRSIIYMKEIGRDQNSHIFQAEEACPQ
jgi:hypothetical protein